MIINRVDPKENPIPVYCKYGSQQQPQPAYIALDLGKETLSASYTSEISGGQTLRVWHGYERHYAIPPEVTAEGINEILDNEEVHKLVLGIVAQYSSKWNGHNHVAVFADPDAVEDMEIKLAALIDELANGNLANVRDAFDYFAAATMAELIGWHKSINAATRDLFETAELDGVLFPGGIDNVKRAIQQRINEFLED